jgi:TolA-binding protein
VVSAAAPDELYKNALNDYTRGNYDLAVTGFLNYIAFYPKTSLILQHEELQPGDPGI